MMTKDQRDLARRYTRGEIDIRYRFKSAPGRWTGWRSLRRTQARYGAGVPFPWAFPAQPGEVEYREGPAPRPTREKVAQ